MKKLKINRELIINIIILISYAVLVFYILYNHESWSDEAQNWLLVKELNFIELFKQLKFEGHPIIWYLILMPFAKLNFPFKYMFLLPYIILLISSFFVVFKMKASKILKILILLSTSFIYVGPVFLRSYCLCILLMMLITYMFKKRYNNPIIYGCLLIFLINTHIVCFGFASSLIVYELYLLANDIIKYKHKCNYKSQIIIISLFFLGFIFLILQLLNAFSARQDIFSQFTFLKIAISSIDLLFLISNENMIVQFILSIWFVFLIYILIRKKEMKVLLFTSYNIIFFIVLNSIYGFNYWQMSMFSLIFVFIICNYKLEKYLKYMFLIFFIINLFSNIPLIIKDIKYDYSSAEKISKYIKNNVDSSEKIYCYDQSLCVTLLLYLNDEYNFYDAYDNHQIKWIDWPTQKLHNKINKLYKINYDNKKYFIGNKLNYYKYPKCNVKYKKSSIREDYIICEIK